MDSKDKEMEQNIQARSNQETSTTPDLTKLKETIQELQRVKDERIEKLSEEILVLQQEHKSEMSSKE